MQIEFGSWPITEIQRSHTDNLGRREEKRVKKGELKCGP
jgi:hypothetical protein